LLLDGIVDIRTQNLLLSHPLPTAMFRHASVIIDEIAAPILVQ
jgi:hypothetical protein